MSKGYQDTDADTDTCFSQDTKYIRAYFCGFFKMNTTTNTADGVCMYYALLSHVQKIQYKQVMYIHARGNYVGRV